MDILIICRFNTNTWRLCFWVCAYVLYDPSLSTVIRSEISPFTSNYTSLSSLHANLSSCKRLNSVYHEVLRLVDSPVSSQATFSALECLWKISEDYQSASFLPTARNVNSQTRRKCWRKNNLNRSPFAAQLAPPSLHLVNRYQLAAPSCYFIAKFSPTRALLEPMPNILIPSASYTGRT